MLRLCILGEIVSAKNFEYDGLYVHYFVELPRRECLKICFLFFSYFSMQEIIDRFTNIFKFMDVSSPRDIVTSYSINL